MTNRSRCKNDSPMSLKMFLHYPRGNVAIKGVRDSNNLPLRVMWTRRRRASLLLECILWTRNQSASCAVRKSLQDPVVYRLHPNRISRRSQLVSMYVAMSQHQSRIQGRIKAVNIPCESAGPQLERPYTTPGLSLRTPSLPAQGCQGSHPRRSHRTI